jgi:hypothetical protein
MKQETKKFLEFKGKSIWFLSKNGTYWVAVKPICEILNVDYIRQFKSLKKSDILANVFAMQQIHDSIGRVQEMLCLPERYVYGWLFSINSNSPELLAYKKEVYDVLYDYFRGAIVKRQEFLQERVAVKEEMQQIEKQIADEKYKQLTELKAKQRQINKSLKKLDDDLLHGQLNLKI